MAVGENAVSCGSYGTQRSRRRAVSAVIGELVAEWYADSSGYDELRLAACDESNPNHAALQKELADQKHLMIAI